MAIEGAPVAQVGGLRWLKKGFSVLVTLLGYRCQSLQLSTNDHGVDKLQVAFGQSQTTGSGSVIVGMVVVL